MKRLAAIMFGGAVGVVLMGSDAPMPSFSESETRILASMVREDGPPPDPTNAFADDPRAARFGQALFFDPRLSADGTISCATCHDPSRAFTDGATLAHGLEDVDRHTPTVIDVAFNRWFFWDGRADTMWGQAMIPFETPEEHGFTRAGIARVIGSDPAMRAAYEAIFGATPIFDRAADLPDARPIPRTPAHAQHAAWDALTDDERESINRIFVNVGKSVAAYERTLISSDTPFDRFARALEAGDPEASTLLPIAAQRGAKLFIGPANCRLCHFGPRFSDGEFHSTGVPPLDGGPLRDSGRFDGIRILQTSPFTAGGVWSDDRTGDHAERASTLVRTTESWGQFKTPSLRGVAETAPYMHEGQFESLERVVRHYNTLEGAILPSHHQEQLLQPLNLTPREQADLVAFLRSLTPPPLPDDRLRAPDADSD